jgi:hypothetical protein
MLIYLFNYKLFTLQLSVDISAYWNNKNNLTGSCNETGTKRSDKNQVDKTVVMEIYAWQQFFLKTRQFL